MTALRSAIVGSGFVARVHAAAVRDMGGAVVAVCSRTRSGARQLADEVGGVTAYDSLEELLRGEAIDVVHICTPNALHADHTLLALEHGAHVVCEKPLATSTEESGRMLEALQGTDRIGAVAYHVRGYPLVEHMRRLSPTMGWASCASCTAATSTSATTPSSSTTAGGYCPRARARCT